MIETLNRTRLTICLRTIVLMVFACLIFCSKDKPTSPTPRNPMPTWTVPGVVRSYEIGDDLMIYVGLPVDYDSTRSEPYHTIYLLDGDDFFDASFYGWGNGNFPLGDKGVWGILDSLTADGAVPKSVLVSIGYDGTPFNFRNREFIHQFNNFKNFLLDELIPLIDYQYNTNSSAGRTLMGHSLGGTAVIQILGTYIPGAPWPFNNFVALSGEYTMFSNKGLRSEAELARQLGTGANLPVNFFMACGDLDTLTRIYPDNLKMMDSLFSRNYQQFQLDTTIYEGLDHHIAKEGFTDGLKSVFK